MNICHLFASENIEVIDGRQVDLSNLYARFRSWVKESFPNNDIMDRPTFKSEMINLLGDPTNNISWNGYQLKMFTD